MASSRRAVALVSAATPEYRVATAMPDHIYRSMTSHGGKPECGPTARTLGVRVPEDISPDRHGRVRPARGGMSVSPDSPTNLPRHRRPAHLGGTGKDPVFVFSVRDLGERLNYRSDPRSPTTHGFVEPTELMLISQFQQDLCATRAAWRSLP
jgi:hypothetical protein